jgi:SAM-dependent methyltransferase
MSRPFGVALAQPEHLHYSGMTMDHQKTIHDQFTRQAVVFSSAPSMADPEAIRLLIEAGRATGTHRSLDVACGPGLVALAFASVVRSAVGLDTTQAMLDRARELQHQQKVANTEWVLGEAYALPCKAINQVVFDGLYAPNNQTEVPHSIFWNPAHPVPERDLDGAQALLQQAGVKHTTFTLRLANTPVDAQIGEVIQAMAKDAGFDVKLEQLESNTSNARNLAGDFDVALLTWSGRADPDANVSIWMACNGPFNFGAYCDPTMDALLKQGRETRDTDKRVAIYRKVADQYLSDMPQIILFNYTWIWALSDRVEGFVPNRDGLIRPQGLRLKPQ